MLLPQSAHTTTLKALLIIQLSQPVAAVLAGQHHATGKMVLQCYQASSAMHATTSQLCVRTAVLAA